MFESESHDVCMWYVLGWNSTRLVKRLGGSVVLGWNSTPPVERLGATWSAAADVRYIINVHPTEADQTSLQAGILCSHQIISRFHVQPE